MEKPIISIIVPVYNVEKYLPKCLDSIIAQSYQNIEIILVDDGSPDNSGTICDDYAANDNRIKVIHKKNEGVNEARITGLEKSEGNYITFIDSDDYIDKEYIYHLYENMEKYHVAMSCCQLIRVYPDKEIKDGRKEVGLFDRKQIDDFLSTDFLYDYKTRKAGFFNGQGGKMYERSWLKEALNAGRSLEMGEDTLMNFYLMQRIPSLFISSSYLYYYTQHASQVTRQFDMKTWNYFVKQWERILEYDVNGYLTHQLACRILHNLRSYIFRAIPTTTSYGHFVRTIRQLFDTEIINSFLFEYKFEDLNYLDTFFIRLVKKRYFRLLYILSNALYKGVKIRDIILHKSIS